jgi:hypothetical protein
LQKALRKQHPLAAAMQLTENPGQLQFLMTSYTFSKKFLGCIMLSLFENVIVSFFNHQRVYTLSSLASTN